MNNFGEKVSFIWSVAHLLRGPYKPAQYGKVANIEPITYPPGPMPVKSCWSSNTGSCS